MLSCQNFHWQAGTDDEMAPNVHPHYPLLIAFVSPPSYSLTIPYWRHLSKPHFWWTLSQARTLSYLVVPLATGHLWLDRRQMKSDALPLTTATSANRWSWFCSVPLALTLAPWLGLGTLELVWTQFSYTAVMTACLPSEDEITWNLVRKKRLILLKFGIA